MGFSTVCVFMFCVYIATTPDELASVEMQFDVLEQRSRLSAHNFTYLHESLDYHVNTDIETAMHSSIVNITQSKLEDLRALHLRAQKAGKDGKKCYETFELQLLTNVTNAVSKLEPCLGDVAKEYKQLSTDLRIGKKNTDELLASIKGVNSYCGNKEPAKAYECIKDKLQLYTEKEDALQREYLEHEKKFQNILSLLNTTAKCIDDHKNDYNNTANSYVQNAAACMGLPHGI